MLILYDQDSCGSRILQVRLLAFDISAADGWTAFTICLVCALCALRHFERRQPDKRTLAVLVPFLLKRAKMKMISRAFPDLSLIITANANPSEWAGKNEPMLLVTLK